MRVRAHFLKSSRTRLQKSSRARACACACFEIFACACVPTEIFRVRVRARAYLWKFSRARAPARVFWNYDLAYMTRVFLDDENFVRTDNFTRIPLLDNTYHLFAIESVPGYCVFENL